MLGFFNFVFCLNSTIRMLSFFANRDIFDLSPWINAMKKRNPSNFWKENSIAFYFASLWIAERILFKFFLKARKTFFLKKSFANRSIEIFENLLKRLRGYIFEKGKLILLFPIPKLF